MAFVPEEEIDHISNLPDAIIDRIFSFLPFKDVVKTSVLSKQWRFAWTSTPYIDLSIHSEDVVPLISRSLSHCTAARLEKFHIDVWIPIDLEGWCCFAAARKVEDASLVFGHRHPWCKIPRALFDCASMVSLRLSNCDLPRAVTIHWPSLKTLCLHMVVLEKGRTMKFLSRCPVLESLRLSLLGTRSDVGDHKLRIHSGSLRELVMENVYTSSLDISAPNLLSLRFSGGFFHKGVGLNGASSLAEAELNFDRPASYLGYSSDWLKFLLEQLQHVPKITFGSRCLEILSTAELNETLYISSTWLNIIVHITLSKSNFVGIVYLLKSSPLMESMVVRNHVDDNITVVNRVHAKFRDFDEKQFWLSQMEFYGVANHLKRVEIYGFELDNKRSKLLLGLAKFLLEKAVGLAKMIIEVELRMLCRGVPIELHDLGDFPNVIQLQEDCRRGSPNAEVIIKYRLGGLPYELCKHKQIISPRYTSIFP